MRKKHRLLLLLIVSFAIFFEFGELSHATQSLTALSLEQLMDLEVTIASQAATKLSDTAAAVFVITQEDIRRSGATSIPELLRMVPGFQVARIDNSKWAVTARGFNGRFANKLLVLQDGRSLYDPLFSGVLWNVHTPLLEDIEQIEVIRGPGASLWGANAVNGVVNIITKSAMETQGTLIMARSGTEENAFAAARQGFRITPESFLSGYVKAFSRDGSVTRRGENASDDWRGIRGNLRFENVPIDTPEMMIEGSYYQQRFGQTFIKPEVQPPFATQFKKNGTVRGGYLLGRLGHEKNRVKWKLQSYYDAVDFEDKSFDYTRHTFDLDFQHSLKIRPRHRLDWGLGYRLITDELDKTRFIEFDPDERTYHLFSAFLQGTVSLVPQTLELILGAKFENNDYTGFEIQPTAKLLWHAAPETSLWASVSRAVRTPSRGDDDIRVPVETFPGPLLAVALGDRDVEAENLIAYEAGLRSQVHANLFLDVALFYHDYDDLRAGKLVSTEFKQTPVPHGVLEIASVNAVEGESYGLEVAGNWRFSSWGELKAAYSYLQLLLDKDIDETIFEEFEEGEIPHHQASLRALLDPHPKWELDFWLRYVDELEALDIDSYLTLDTRVSWQASRNLEISLVGQNLLDPQHPEFSGFDYVYVQPTEVERSVYAEAVWEF